MKISDLNISVCSYNLNWKIMQIPINKKSKINEPYYKFKINLLQNIQLIHYYYNPFIYCFQEVVNPQHILKIFDLDNFDFNIGDSGLEKNLTIWNKQIFKKKMIIGSEFEEGRPFTIIILNDKRFKINFMLVNIHAGHDMNTLKTIFNPIQNTIQADNFIYKKLIDFDIKRIIICGDFNRNINLELANDIQKILHLKIGRKKYYFNFNSNSNENKTCCSMSGYGYKYNYDNLIDSYAKPIATTQLTNEKWYIPKSSDHLMILSIVKNFI